MMKALNAVKGSYASWDETVQKLKASYQALAQDPAQADALAPDRKQWDAVHTQWKTW
jgi:predicted lipoprotein